MSFRTDKIRGKHPITPKKGIKETDLNIKEKGNNDTIKVSIKPKSNMKLKNDMMTGKQYFDLLDDEPKINILATLMGIKSEHVDIGGLEYGMLDKWVRKGLTDMAKESRYTDKVLKKLANKQLSTFGRYSEEKKKQSAETNLIDMDDQGFEGQWGLKDGKPHFHRWIDDVNPEEDEIRAKYRKMSNPELENAWQGSSMTISMALQQYYKNGDEKLKKMAEDAQKRQQLIQDEITRRH